MVVEGKNANAAFVPFRLVNYLCPAPASLAAAVAEVAELICQEEKYEAGECLLVAAFQCDTFLCGAADLPQCRLLMAQARPHAHAAAQPAASEPLLIGVCPFLLPTGIRDLTSVCFRIIEIPERRVGALLGPSGSHIKSLQVRVGEAGSCGGLGKHPGSGWPAVGKE